MDAGTFRLNFVGIEVSPITGMEVETWMWLQPTSLRIVQGELSVYPLVLRPLSAALNEPTVFTVTGSDLPSTLALAITHADDCGQNSGGSEGQHTFTCIPRIAGVQDYVIKDRPGGETLQTGTVTITSPFLVRPLNDTGIDWCGDAANNYDTGDAAYKEQQCVAVVNAGFPGQDGHHGRDARARAGTLAKVGGGNAGFDYTKISNSGAVLPASATFGSGPNAWACTRDNVTGLIWEVKVNDPSHLRHQDDTYTWYDPTSPDGNPGVQNGGNCLVGSSCDTSGFVEAVNQQGLCGATDWRMPTRRELQGIVDYGRHSPAIDLGYFPNTPSSVFWSGSPNANNSNNAWGVSFGFGVAHGSVRGGGGRVRLVRGGQ